MLPYREFLKMQAEIENYEGLKALRDEKASAHSESIRSLDAVLKELGDRSSGYDIRSAVACQVGRNKLMISDA